MNEIIIKVQKCGRVSDQDVLRVVRAAINESIKYESDRTLNHHHYWHNPNKGVQLQITFK